MRYFFAVLVKVNWHTVHFPIRHARPFKSVHSRYRHFFPYGDAEGYREGLNEERTKFDDV